MELQLIRHATLWVRYAGINFLLDPMFSDEGANPPIVKSANDRRNPLVPLPDSIERWLRPDAVLVTHLHRDHWDQAASDALYAAVPVLCQPGDEKAIRSFGFRKVNAVKDTVQFKGAAISRTGGRHGRGFIGLRMGRASGFVFRSEGEPTLYVAGDTIWCGKVKQALDRYKPDVTVVNAGAAQFAVGRPITMDADDVIHVCRHAPYTKVVAVHMEAMNHCLVTRADLHRRVAAEGLLDGVIIPKDGESIIFEGEIMEV